MIRPEGCFSPADPLFLMDLYIKPGIMKLPIYQLDVFTNNIFEGNPAAVVVMDECINQHLMQSIAMENNLSETAFIHKEKDHYKIRWFTPTVDVDLCGHATMASGHLVLYILEPNMNEVTFHSAKYELKVRKEEDYLAMRLPSAGYQKADMPRELAEGLKKEPVEFYKGEDYMAVFDSQKDIAEMEPDYEILKTLDARGIIATAPGYQADFVSRFFAPSLGINEDPVTGSAHALLIPYWSKKLNKKELWAEQLSPRGGRLMGRDLGEHIELLGNARKYLEGFINTK